MSKPILDNAQYDNFFRNLSEIVHADLPTFEAKRDALIELTRENGDDADLSNLSEFVSWFTDGNQQVFYTTAF